MELIRRTDAEIKAYVDGYNRRTDAEIKAYAEGYCDAYKMFCECLKERPLTKAIRKMQVYVDIVIPVLLGACIGKRGE